MADKIFFYTPNAFGEAFEKAGLVKKAATQRIPHISYPLKIRSHPTTKCFGLLLSELKGHQP